MTTQLVLLGTGTPNADPERSGSSLAIIVNDRPYLVDAGPGVVRRASAAHQRGVTGLAVNRLNRVFLTHLHSDHTIGLPDLLLTPWVLERDAPLDIYGPAGTREMVDHLLAAYAQDIHERLTGLEPANTTGCTATVTEITAGVCYQDDLVVVEAFPVRHGAWAAFGYKFTTPDRVIVISGDTCPVESVVEQAAGCDILVHEVYSVAGFQRRPAEWQRYHASVHTSAYELAAIARRTQPGLLVLVHQLFWGTSPDELVAEVRSGYGGAVVCGNDLDVF
ncbi:MAG: MBL fold metallo-hydrolase [Anaerolineaceae bacterium]|nr:MBL fold metallo-hydrolase [Anaerolineaceae bacterium]